MIGAIIGDIIGSVYEWRPVKSTEFSLYQKESRFTDDTVLTIATAESILRKIDFAENYKRWALKYPKAGYGKIFMDWTNSDSLLPYNSWGNGSAMRISPVGFAFDKIDDVFLTAENSAKVTHNHPEGIKGAQTVASAIFLARQNSSKEEIKNFIENNFGYDLSRNLDEIRPKYKFDVSCQGSVPESIISFLESVDYESAVKNAVSLGGDSDTMACIAGGIAQAYYKKIDRKLIDFAFSKLSQEMIVIINEFENKFNL